MGLLQRITAGLWLVLCLGGVMLIGCHTVEGAGEDIQEAGRAIERAAD